MDKRNFSRPLDLKQVTVTDAFWHREQELVRKEVLPYQWEALNDRIPDAAPSYCMHNFRAAGRMMQEKQKKGNTYVAPSYTFRGFEALPEDPKNPEPDKFYGFVFQDSDFSKWIEAVGYSLTQHPDAQLEQTADEAIDLVCAAQLENGYLDTYYIINGMDRAFTNLKDHHELYCLGHLIEGAVAYYQATGKDKLLNAARRYADYVAVYFGPQEDQCKGYPGHEIAEMALVRLYEVTGDNRYLELSRFFLNQRGTKPYYFDEEERKRAVLEGRENQLPKFDEEERYAYYQAHKPVCEQEEAVGHAVRAVYLYSGMADVARLTEDEAMYAACQRLWENIVREKLYVTGGIGGTSHGESFSFPFDLPNDTSYSETCAAIGLAFFARRMLEIKAESQYADVCELALYNTVLSGMALDGKSFFYVNPLEVLPEACHKDFHKSHVKPVRQKWFGCACCPPNIARIVSWRTGDESVCGDGHALEWSCVCQIPHAGGSVMYLGNAHSRMECQGKCNCGLRRRSCWYLMGKRRRTALCCAGQPERSICAGRLFVSERRMAGGRLYFAGVFDGGTYRVRERARARGYWKSSIYKRTCCILYGGGRQWQRLTFV